MPGRRTGRLQPFERIHFRVLVPGAKSQKIAVVQDRAADEPPACNDKGDAACQQSLANHLFPFDLNAIRFLMDKALYKDRNATQQEAVSVIVGHSAQTHANAKNPAAAPIPLGLQPFDPGIYDDARRQKCQRIHIHIRMHEHALGQEADKEGEQQRGAALLKQPGG